MEHLIDYVDSAVSRVKFKLLQAYFFLTSSYPRLLPRNETEFDNLKRVLHKYYSLEDDPTTWITVSGQITGVPPTSVRKSYGSLANAARRLRINQVAHQKKLVEIEKIELRLKEATEKLAKDLAEKEALEAPDCTIVS